MFRVTSWPSKSLKNHFASSGKLPEHPPEVKVCRHIPRSYNNVGEKIRILTQNRPKIGHLVKILDFFKKSKNSNQDIFMSFWIYKNSFRIRRFQPETSKNRCLLVDPDLKNIYIWKIFFKYSKTFSKYCFLSWKTFFSGAKNAIFGLPVEFYLLDSLIFSFRQVFIDVWTICPK